MRVGCERAKEEVELLEMEKRAAAGGMLGGTEQGTESRACRLCASILARIRTLAQHQRHATLRARGLSIADGYETDAAVRAHVNA